ncbi:MAG: hypothetical protein ABI165_07235 [Bryobacteraceae bacterium]
MRVSFRGSLTAYRGKLLSGESKGRAVHAGAFVRKRKVVLDAALRKQPAELRRILAHEIFHFAWVRLGNPARRAWELLVETELAAGARGELGWSAEHRKAALRPADRTKHARRWREYLCESFCDSGAFVYAGVRRHAEYTLAARFRERRREWMRQLFSGRGISI